MLQADWEERLRPRAEPLRGAGSTTRGSQSRAEGGARRNPLGTWRQIRRALPRTVVTRSVAAALFHYGATESWSSVSETTASGTPIASLNKVLALAEADKLALH